MEIVVHPPRTLDLILGKIAQKYLPRAKDDKFGLCWDKKKSSYMFGNSIVCIDNLDIIIDEKSYKGTHGGD